MNALPGGKYAWRLGAAFLTALALLVFFAFRDRARVEQLEQFEAITAVGDTTYYRPTNDVNAVAILDIATATFTSIQPLGKKNFLTGRHDFSDRDGAGAVALASFSKSIL